MAAGNRPLPNIRADFGGFHNAANIEARAGAVSAQLLNQGFARAQSAITQGIEGKKHRKHQASMQEKQFAEAERQDLRQFSIAQMRQNAINARAMIDMKKGQAQSLQRQIEEYTFVGEQAPQQLVDQLNQVTNEMGQLAAQGAGQIMQARQGEQALGLPQGSVAPGGFEWSELFPRVRPKPACKPGGT